MKKKSILSLLAIAGIILVFFLILQNNKRKNQEELAIVSQVNTEVAVRVANVQEEQMSGQFSANGTFIPQTQAQIAAELGGQVIALHVQEGSLVKPGQIIARLSQDKIDVNLSNAKAVLDNAEATLKRYEAAFASGGITAVQLDQARLQVENAKAQYQSASLSSGDTQIYSKVSGIVNRKLVEIGSIIGAGTPIVEVVDISSLKLKVEMDEAVVGRLEIGDSVKVLPSAVNQAFDGEITFIAPSSNGALKFPVEITVDNPNGNLRAGMYATAQFSQNGVQDVLTVPREAFVGSVSDSKVFVIKDGKAQLTTIQTGINYGDKVEVIEGLNPGDQVVTSGQINLLDNTAVRIIQ